LTNVNVTFEEDTVWLTQEPMAELFQKAKSTTNYHIQQVYEDRELDKEATMRKIENFEFSAKPMNFYNLDMVISVGYRVRSQRGVQFRLWAAGIIKEYMRKGFALDNTRLKDLGGGGYFKGLLARIRDIRASEKVFYRQVLEIYATSIDYDPRAAISIEFFKKVQNKIHYAVHGETVAEAIYHRADCGKGVHGADEFCREPANACRSQDGEKLPERKGTASYGADSIRLLGLCRALGRV